MISRRWISRPARAWRYADQLQGRRRAENPTSPYHATQISCSFVCSSMFMSLNSLDSKISPHSLHSTNSESSSRLTICTRGCLQACFISTLLGEGCGVEVINPGGCPLTVDGQNFAGISRYCKTAIDVVKPPSVTRREFVK